MLTNGSSVKYPSYALLMKIFFECWIYFPCCSKDAFTVCLPPAWVDVSEEVAANIQRSRVKMAELVKAQAKALMPSFEDGKEDQRKIESLTQEITDLLKRSEKRLQKLSARGPSEDSNVRKNVQVGLDSHCTFYYKKLYGLHVILMYAHDLL